MTDADDLAAAWRRLGQIVTNRRVGLGYRKREDFVNDNAGIKLRTLGDIEAGRRTSYHPNTIASLENALRWKVGNIAAALDGGEPTVLDDSITNVGATAAVAGLGVGSRQAPTDEDPLVTVMRDPHLTDEQKARIIRTLIAEQERYARERADELIRDARSE